MPTQPESPEPKPAEEPAEPTEEQRRLAHMADAIEEVHYRWYTLSRAKDLPTQSAAIVALGDAISNLSTWHPGHDPETGRMPWEIKADEEENEIFEAERAEKEEAIHYSAGGANLHPVFSGESTGNWFQVTCETCKEFQVKRFLDTNASGRL